MKLSLLLVSAAVISYQLLLLHNLSITQWYHFASMIISVALLGFGASGTFLTLFRKKVTARPGLFYFLFLCLAGLFMMISFRLTQLDPYTFDSYLVFSSWQDMSRLLITYLLLFIPFFFAAAAIGLLFTTKPQKIGNLYFINLAGSGLGGLVLLFILNYLKPQTAIACIAFLPLIAALMVLPVNKRADNLHANQKDSKQKGWSAALVILFILAIVNVLFPPELYLSDYKSLSRVTDMPDTEVVAEDTNPYGLLQVVTSPYIRYAPGLSLNFTGEMVVENVVFNNGNWVGPLFDVEDTIDFYDYSTLSLPYVIRQNDKVLVLEAGTGEAVKPALRNDAAHVTAVEANRALVDYLKTDVEDEMGVTSILNHPRVETVTEDPYAYLLTTEESYDLIHLPLYDAFGGASGINAAEEKPLMSLESFQRMWDNLDENGLITISAWIDVPLRYPLRIIATMAELLEENQIDDPQKHLAAIRNWSLTTFVISKSPLCDEKTAHVRNFCSDKAFDMLLLPGLQEDEREIYHKLSDRSILLLSNKLLASRQEREELYDEYAFKINPVDDDRPFPFQFLKISRLNELREQFTLFELPYLEIGYFLVLTTFGKAVILAALFIILPLLITMKMDTGKTRTFIYFFALGMGFLMVEIVLIQRFITYLGTPLYSSSVIITGILFFSGLGSNLSGKLRSLTDRRPPLNKTANQKSRKVTSTLSSGSHQDSVSGSGGKSHSHSGSLSFIIILTLIAVLIIVYALVLNPILHLTIDAPFAVKVLLTLFIIAPLAFLMGFPFPLGISHIHQTGNKNNISWAWGINGSISVISSILATIIAIESGFTAVKILAAACYLFALLSVLAFKK